MKNAMTAVAALAGVAIFAADDIAKIDRNFQPETLKSGEKIVYSNPFRKPFEVTGFPWSKTEDGILYRIPRELTSKDVRSGVLKLAHRTSGGAIRFATDSPIIVVRGFIHWGGDMGHMPRSGSAGLDLAVNCGTPEEALYSPMRPSPAAVAGKEQFLMVTKVGDGPMREYTLFLPLYSGIKSMEIGVTPDAKIAPPKPQKIKYPICFYGSSITQGGCASRPANNYTTMLCRAVDAPQINLGFSGNARGEAAMAKAIAKLKLSAFVMDYDYNAPTPEHLRKTHEKFFRIIREAQPDLPIIIVSGPREKSSGTIKRRDIVKATYDRAVAAGDRHVYFVDGLSFFDEVPRKYATVDNTHPTDLGFYVMFRKILPVLKQALGK